MKKLSLKKETLAELTTDELRGVAGAADAGGVVGSIAASCYGVCPTRVQQSCYEECLPDVSDPIYSCPTLRYCISTVAR